MLVTRPTPSYSNAMQQCLTTNDRTVRSGPCHLLLLPYLNGLTDCQCTVRTAHAWLIYEAHVFCSKLANVFHRRRAAFNLLAAALVGVPTALWDYCFFFKLEIIT